MHHVARDRRHADEGAAARGDQVRHTVLDAEHGAEHVQVQDAHELLRVLHVIGAEATAATRVGDHAVEAPGGLEGARDRRLHLLFVGDVAADPLHAAAVPGLARDALGRSLELGLAAPADRDRRAVGGEPQRAGGADAGAAAGHEHGAAFEAAGGARGGRHRGLLGPGPTRRPAKQAG